LKELKIIKIRSDLMDSFENYLFNRISELKSSIENSNNDIDEVGKKEILWSLNNTMEELLEIFANYVLNHKIYG